MIRLFEKNATVFTTLGLGVITDAEECTVDEELNGSFELSMRYPSTGARFSSLTNGAIIFCKPNPYAAEQPFRIVEIHKNIDKTIDIRAQHISYQLSYIPASPCSGTTASSALNNLKTNALETCPFTFWSNVTKTGEFKFSEPKSIRSLLGGGDSSVAGVFGGEFEFDNYSIKLHQNRGQNRGATFRYGRDLIDMRQEENIAEVITGIVPYWKGNVQQIENSNAIKITTTKGYYSHTAHTKTTDDGCRCVEISVTAGTIYAISTNLRPTTVAGVVFYNSSNAVVKYELLGLGEEEVVTDYYIEVPSGATKMAVNSCEAVDPVIVKDVEITVAITAQNGYWSNTSHTFVSNSAYRGAEVECKSGEEFVLSTTVNSSSVAGLIFYNQSNSVIGYALVGQDEEESVTDYGFTVPTNAVKMAVNSASTTAPTLKRVSSTSTSSVEVMVMLTDKVIHSSNASSFPYQRTASLNLTSNFDIQPTEAELRTAANKYLQDNTDIGVPKVNIEVTAVDLRKTAEYEGLNFIPQVLIGDTVTVIFEELGVSSSAEVIKTSYDVLKDEYISIDLGDTKPDLADTIVATNKAAEEAKSAAEGTIQAYVARLKAENEVALQETIKWIQTAMEVQADMIRGGLGGHIVTRTNPGGWPEELLIMDTDSISTCQSCIRLNKNGIGFSKSGYNGPFTSTWTIDGTFDAQTINVINLNGASLTIGTIKDRNGNIEWSLDTGNMIAKKLNIIANNFYLKDTGEIRSTQGSTTSKHFTELSGAAIYSGFTSKSEDDTLTHNNEYNWNYIANGNSDGTTTNSKYNSSMEINAHAVAFEVDQISVSDHRGKLVSHSGAWNDSDNPAVHYGGGSGNLTVSGVGTITFVNGIMVTNLT